MTLGTGIEWCDATSGDPIPTDALRDRKGGDWDEWPADLRIPRVPQERPHVTLTVVPVNRDQVRLFIREHHRHNGPLPVEILKVGLGDEDGELVGVAIAGLPPRELMDGFTLEVARCCTLGHENACSMLYARIIRGAKALGWRRLYTYTLASEPGSSVRAVGFVEDGRVPARPYLSKTRRPRYDENLFGERTVPEEEKVRWRLDLIDLIPARSAATAGPESRDASAGFSAGDASGRARKGGSVTERQLQDAVVAAARALGWLVYHTFDSRRSEPGFPDLVMVRRARVVFAELKTAAGTVKTAQLVWLRAFAAAGEEVHLWRPADWTSGTVEEVLR